MKSMLIYPIIHCEFEYEYPLNWGDLKPKSDEMVRYCDQCAKEVTLCLDDVQIDAAWESGLCIAHPFYSPQMIEKILAYENGEGPYPFAEISMPMGIPKRRDLK